jgi:hypothetical protein
VTGQKKQLIIFALLGVILVGVLAFQFTRKQPPPPGTQKVGTQKAGEQKAGAPKAPASAKTAGKTPAPSAKNAKPGAPAASAKAGETAESQIKKVDVNIDDLLAGIKEVDFDYDTQRMPRDPMAPLVGTITKARESTEPGGTSPAPATAVQVMSKIVSGILWDDKRPLAVVDNEVVYPGYEYPDGTAVASIERHRVVFKVGDSLIQVELKEL